MGPEISWTAWNSSPEKKGVKAQFTDFMEALGAPYTKDFPGGSGGKASAYNAGDPGSIPGGPVIRTLCFHCREQEFHHWSGD